MQNDEMLLMIREFSNVLNEFNSKAFKFIDEQLNKTGLGRTHFGILHALVDGKELPMSDLSEILHVTKPNITVLIDKLTKMNYVERISSSSDRRVFLIRLTDEGKNFLDESAAELIKSSISILNNLTNEDVGLIKQTTQTLKNLMIKFNK
ncbi:MarR family winged helix-turn-helix transcriptional regulator [Clostridium beijerinckii]|uniref:MarR family transcriptional regulator n=3 Tax=Clostridiaceae TaxID=31979 RepID=A0A399IM97_9CLOT|nr:MarR family transcriptional regulator [Clostridium beijerinckii]EHI99921.1 regulatory protein MarR [Clostridium sp. DL-VIII]RII34218.1 MarR family transcriptional regulator [Clostridium chromiireducens]AQS05943.1 HTH-type transcriptional regulator MhqR [Clostridium beijerinckii]MBA2888149.1 DNA-binding MarR family transcriptional regulator [Clostridium beijerinckii]MBA2902831.1 DNA-binding MarR family transcriptional regulator [Clostridium beijerinckii]